MRDGSARDGRDRRRGVGVEAHRGLSLEEEAASAAYLAVVTEESQRDEMNDAIRAQRERGNVPKSMLPPEDERVEPPPPTEPEPPRRGFLGRLLGR